MYLQVAVISIETQSIWWAWNSVDSSQRTTPLTEEAMALIIQFTFPLFHGVEASVNTLPKNSFENKGDRKWQIGRRPHLDTKQENWKEEQLPGLGVAAVECRDTIINFYKCPACVQEGVKSANHVCHRRMGTTGQLRESNRQWSLLIYKSSHVLIYGASPHPFQKRLISKMMKL